MGRIFLWGKLIESTIGIKQYDPFYTSCFLCARPFMELIGCDADYIASGGSYFTAETHIRHLSEALAGDRIRVETQMILGEGKKLHLFHRMWRGEEEIATAEHFLLHVSLETRRPSPPADKIEAALAAITAGHSGLPKPESAGASIRQP